MLKNAPVALELIELLGASNGLVACVGAGGKKSVIYHLAARYPGTVGITATAHIERFPRAMAAYSVVAESPGLVAEVVALSKHQRVVAFAKPCELPGRHLGITFDELRSLRRAAAFELCLVKADGARNRILKAPAAHEPVIPPETDTVIALCSARAIGEPLTDRIAHRPEHIATVAGLALGARIEPIHLGRLLASPAGALRGVGAARVIPVINMVDDATLERQAVAAAEAALALTTRFDYIVLAAFRNQSPLVRVVKR